MRVKFICIQAQKKDNWHPGRLVHSARLVPVVDDRRRPASISQNHRQAS